MVTRAGLPCSPSMFMDGWKHMCSSIGSAMSKVGIVLQELMLCAICRALMGVERSQGLGALGEKAKGYSPRLQKRSVLGFYYTVGW